MTTHSLSQLRALEAESIHIFREVAAEMQRPCLLFSGGKDSIVMLHVARKAFAPARIPFPVMHVDTGLNFPEILAYRDRWIEKLGLKLVVASVPDAIERGFVQEEPNGSRNRIQTPVLLETAERHRFDALFGGARRDEEKARAKERVFSFRDEFGQWDPKNQRPEIWSLYNGKVHMGQSIRVFPLSNWTELDVWTYIAAEAIEIPELYLARERAVVERGGMLYAVNEFTPLRDGDTARTLRVRYRTVGDANLTAAVESDADTIEKIVEEIAVVRITERGATRGDDKTSETAMEDRKKRRLLLSRWTFSASRPPARSTTGRARSSGVCCTTASRCSPISLMRWSEPAVIVATNHTDLVAAHGRPAAEREQGITIDVAYRYFSTPRRKFILADTPGHVHRRERRSRGPRPQTLR